MGTDYHHKILLYPPGFFSSKRNAYIYTVFFFMSDKLEADKRERREANACFTLHLMTEHGKKELQQLGSKKKKCKAKGVVYV